MQPERDAEADAHRRHLRGSAHDHRAVHAERPARSPAAAAHGTEQSHAGASGTERTKRLGDQGLKDR
jgi:hypothetical protein